MQASRVVVPQCVTRHRCHFVVALPDIPDALTAVVPVAVPSVPVAVLIVVADAVSAVS